MSKAVQAHVLNQYSLLKQMGSGAYGHVWQVQEKKSKKHYALKKVFDAFRNSIDAQRTYRQVQILKQLSHQNIIKLYRVIKSKNKKDLYLLFQFMEADLHSIVGSNILEKMHQIYVFYQILKALKYLHSAQLIHRDLKPSNILLNSQCLVKICDFGLIRTLNSENNQEAILSEEVATKWYRAPELLLGSRSYKKPIDVWSFGCIVAQILTGKPMFAGDSTLNQLEKIIQFTGQVSKQDIESLDSPVAQQLITQIKVKKRSFRQYFSSVDPDYWVMLKGTLQFNPNKRMSIDEVLNLQLFDQFRQQIKNLKICSKVIRPKIDDNTRYHLKIYREKLYQDIDKKQKSQSVKQSKKLSQIKNIYNGNGNSTSLIKKKELQKRRIFSQDNNRSLKQKQKLQSSSKHNEKGRHYSLNNQNLHQTYQTLINKNSLAHINRKAAQIPYSMLNKNSINHKQKNINSNNKSAEYFSFKSMIKNPYMEYYNQVQKKIENEKKMMNNSRSMSLLKNYYKHFPNNSNNSYHIIKKNKSYEFKPSHIGNNKKQNQKNIDHLKASEHILNNNSVANHQFSSNFFTQNPKYQQKQKSKKLKLAAQKISHNLKQKQKNSKKLKKISSANGPQFMNKKNILKSIGF